MVVAANVARPPALESNLRGSTDGQPRSSPCRCHPRGKLKVAADPHITASGPTSDRPPALFTPLPLLALPP